MSNTNENIEPEILARLTIPALIYPCDEDFKPSITEDQLIRYDEKIRPVIFAINRLEAKLDFYADALIQTNRHQRLMEAREIRRNSIKWKIGQWAIVAVVASALATVGKKAIELAWKP